jgi:hypothetical protein
MSSSSSSIVTELYIDDNPDNPLIGYACENVLESNQVIPLEQVFYMDLLTLKGTQSLAIAQVQQGLVDAIATRYQISSGIRCQELPVDGSTWIVQFVIEPDDWQLVEMFGTSKRVNTRVPIPNPNYYSTCLL